MSQRINYKFPAAFTLVEVLVAVMIIGLGSFGLMALLKASDQMAYRGRVDGALAATTAARGGMLVSIPFSVLVGYATAATPVSGTTYAFQKGLWDGENPTGGFPFLLAGELDAGVQNYLLHGKPLPGDVSPRGICPYVELVTVTFNAAPAFAVQAQIAYDIVWTDPLSGAQGTLTFSFVKYDPNRF